MKAEFDENGTLKIYAENHTEAFALKEWWKQYEEGDKVAFGVDIDRYKQVAGRRE